MKRLIIGPSNKMDGEYVIAENPDLIYLDTSAWLDIFRAYRNKKEKIIDSISVAIDNNEFRLFVSIINFFELIGTDGDISRNFDPESFQALNFVRQTSANQPPIISEQEVLRFVNKTSHGVRILDQEGIALKSIIEGIDQRKKGNAQWFQEKRKWWDESNERDRALNLAADIYEQSRIMTRDSLAEELRARNEILNESINIIKVKKAELGQKKMSYRGAKEIPSQEKEIVQNVRHRIELNLCQKYGVEKVSMVVSNFRIIFPGSDEIVTDLVRSSQLTLAEVRKKMPALYWQAKIDYYNRYYGKPGAKGQLGDRNHAVYIPYCNYFGTSDGRLIEALEGEFKLIFVKGKLRLFKIDIK